MRTCWLTACLLPLLLLPSLRAQAADDAPAHLATRKTDAPAIPEGCWDLQRANRLEHALDRYCAETIPGERVRQQRALIDTLQVGLTPAELEAMAAPPTLELGKAVRQATEQQAASHQPRAWFNLALPAHYVPTRSWPLVVALHGSSSDGDNLVPFFQPQLTDAGCIVLYPTTTDAQHLWSDPTEMAAVFSLIEWVGHRYRVDFRRLIITGGSMGGMGTWSHLLAHPEVWAVGASVAGHPAAMQGDILEHLRGIPFYLLHGGNDTHGVSLAPVEDTRAAVAELQARGMSPVYVEVPGAGHTPPMDTWQAMARWMVAQGPKPWSPRPLFLPTQGHRPLSEVELDPLGLDSDDPALVLVREHRAREAQRLLTTRLAQEPVRLDYLYRAYATIPALRQPIPAGATAASFPRSDGWELGNEAAALVDLNRAIHLPGDPPTQLAATAYLWAARIYAKRALVGISRGGTGWVSSWQSFVQDIKACLAVDPACREGAELAQMMATQLPGSVRMPAGGGAGGVTAPGQDVPGGGSGPGGVQFGNRSRSGSSVGLGSD